MRVDLTIRQGATFKFLFRWETAPIIYKVITAATRAAPVRLTVPSHGLVSGWRAAVTDVVGMTELNAPTDPPKDAAYKTVTVVDSNTIEFNTVNSTSYGAYVSGGVLRYNTPVDLLSFTARLKIKDKVGGTVLLELTTENSRIVLNNTDKTITLALTAAETEALTFAKGVYDLELVSPLGEVTSLAEGSIKVTKEVTTTT